MAEYDAIRRELAGGESDSRKVQARPLRQESNHPVPVNEFDREHMGIAAKE